MLSEFPSPAGSKRPNYKVFQVVLMQGLGANMGWWAPCAYLLVFYVGWWPIYLIFEGPRVSFWADFVDRRST